MLTSGKKQENFQSNAQIKHSIDQVCGSSHYQDQSWSRFMKRGTSKQSIDRAKRYINLKDVSEDQAYVFGIDLLDIHSDSCTCLVLRRFRR